MSQKLMKTPKKQFEFRCTTKTKKAYQSLLLEALLVCKHMASLKTRSWIRL